MCDEHTQHDADELLRQSGLTRRQFGKLSAAAGMAAMFPPVANAQAVTETDIEVTTPAGVAACYFVHFCGPWALCGRETEVCALVLREDPCRVRLCHAAFHQRGAELCEECA